MRRVAVRRLRRWMIGCALFGAIGAHAAEEARRPIAVDVTTDGAAAWVACQSGSLVRLSLAEGQIERTIAVGGKITDFVLDPKGQWWAATDADAQQLVIGSTMGTTTDAQRVNVAADPVACAASADGKRVAVTSLWSQSVTCVDMSIPHVDATISLSFAPRKCVWLPDGKHVLVADAYAGKLAVIDADAGKVASVREIPGHNIAALTLSPRGTRVYLTHQMIHRGAQTSRDGVHWGGILTNVVRSLAVTDLFDSQADVLAHSKTDYLGDVGRGAGDPAGVAVRSDGWMLVAFAGVNEIAFDQGFGLNWKRVAVGQRPTALALAPDGRRAIIANTLDDSVSIVSVLDSGQVERTVPLAPPRELTAVERGERLFYDARMSHDGWFSCHSCHTDGHSNRQLVDNFTDGTTGTPKRVLSLLGVRDTAPYAWDGHIRDLHSQVKHSVTSTMQRDAVTDAEAADLVAFLETLRPLPTRLAANSEQRERGQRVFRDQGCVRCHASDVFTSPETYDVGLADEQGLRRFNPPSLRGVGHGGPYFHDGRFERLEDVLAKQRHELASPLSPEDQAALLAFLVSL